MEFPTLLNTPRPKVQAYPPETVIAVMAELVRTTQGDTRARWDTAIKDRAFAPLRPLPVVETKAEHFLRVLAVGTVSTNADLRRLHNFALDMGYGLTPLAADSQEAVARRPLPAQAGHHPLPRGEREGGRGAAGHSVSGAGDSGWGQGFRYGDG